MDVFDRESFKWLLKGKSKAPSLLTILRIHLKQIRNDSSVLLTIYLSFVQNYGALNLSGHLMFNQRMVGGM